MELIPLNQDFSEGLSVSSSDSDSLIGLAILDEIIEVRGADKIPSSGSFDSESDTDNCDSSKICYVCMCKLRNGDNYARINHKDEVNRYHLKCLEIWFDSNDYGIITREPVDFYSIYDCDGKRLEEKLIEKQYVETEDGNVLRKMVLIITGVNSIFCSIIISVLFGVDVIDFRLFALFEGLTFLFFLVIPFVSIKCFNLC